MSKCILCGKEFAPQRNTSGKFCSYLCYWKSLKGKPSKKRSGTFKKCKICGKSFYSKKYRKNHFYCSNKCRAKDLVNKRLSIKTEFKKGQTPWNKNKRFPQFANENNALWKGRLVGYSGLHKWVKRHKGSPKHCLICSKKKSLQWANIDHKYRRNLDDYIPLCSSCHKLFDIKNNKKSF